MARPKRTLPFKLALTLLFTINLTICPDPVVDEHVDNSQNEPPVELDNEPIVDHHVEEQDGKEEHMMDKDDDVNPRFGNDSEAALYINLWETQCLGEALGDLVVDTNDPGDRFENASDVSDKGDLFEQLERWVLEKMDLLKKTDITPFLESIQNREPMKLTDHNQSPFIGGMIFLVVVLVINMIIFCLFTFLKKLRVKQMKKRKCCVSVCLGIVSILGVVSLGLLITNYVWTKNMYRIEENLLCEATRVPHAFLFGNPEIHFEVKKSSHFLGLERIRNYLDIYISESSLYTSGSNSKILQEIEAMKIQNKVAELENTLDEFFTKYEDMKGRDASGRNRVPLSISYTIPYYKSHMTSLIEKYKLFAGYIDKISTFSYTVKNSTRAEEFHRYLKDTSKQLTDYQFKFSEFWNQIMVTSFDSTLGFKISVIGLVVIATLIFISQCANIIAFIHGVKSGKIKSKSNVRCLMILVLFICFWGFMAIFEVGRGIFSSLYGCSVMYQMEHDPYKTEEVIKPYLLQDPHINDFFKHCYFAPKRDSADNFFSLISGENEKIALLNYFSFLDGLKMSHENVLTLSKDLDVYYTDRLIESLKSFKTGESLDFDDVFNNLAKLNYIFSCSNIYYSLTERDCNELPAGKTVCVKILTGNFEEASCMSNDVGESAVLFDELKEYITREQTFIDNILEDVNGSSNDDSIVSKLHTTIDHFDMLDKKIRNISTTLNRDFDKLVPGRLEDWMDCGVVRDEVKKSFNNLCNHDMQKLMKFGDLNAYIILFAMISVNILFCLSCCYTEQSKKKVKEQENLNDTFEDDNIFDKKSGSSSPEYFKKDDSLENIEFKQMGAEFGTFKNPEPVKKDKPTKLQRVDVEDVGFGDKKEDDDFDDPFNQFGDNEYDFKK